MLRHYVPLRRYTAVAAENPERKARRRKRFQRFFSTAIWRAFRERVFERDGYRCVRVVDGVLCPQGRASGTRLVCNHLTYARFGGQELLEDCETLCVDCDTVVTSQTRANWNSNRRRSLGSLSSASTR